MRLLSILALVLFTGLASATPPFAVRSVYVQPVQVQSYFASPVVQQVQAFDAGCVQQFAAQQFYAAPVQFQQAYGVQQVQQFGYAQQLGVQRVQVQRLGFGGVNIRANIGLGGVSVRQGLFGSRVVVRPQVQRIVIR